MNKYGAFYEYWHSLLDSAKKRAMMKTIDEGEPSEDLRRSGIVVQTVTEFANAWSFSPAPTKGLNGGMTYVAQHFW